MQFGVGLSLAGSFWWGTTASFWKGTNVTPLGKSINIIYLRSYLVEDQNFSFESVQIEATYTIVKEREGSIRDPFFFHIQYRME